MLVIFCRPCNLYLLQARVCLPLFVLTLGAEQEGVEHADGDGWDAVRECARSFFFSAGGCLLDAKNHGGSDLHL